MDTRDGEHSQTDNLPRRRTFSLRAKLVLALVCSMAVGFLVMLTIDYQREFLEQVGEELAGLESEAAIHAQAILRIQDHGPGAVQEYLNAVASRPDEAYARKHMHRWVVCIREDDTLFPEGRTLDEQSVASIRTASKSADHRARMGNDDIIVGSSYCQGCEVYVADSVSSIRSWILEDSKLKISGVVAFAIVLAFVIYFVLSRLVAQPVEKMVSDVHLIGSGRFGILTERSNTTELDQLAGAINDMSTSLQKADAERRFAMSKAFRLQQHLLPSIKAIPGMRIERLFLPTAEVAGDFFDIIPLFDGSWLLTLADVTGHGVSAAMTAAMLKAIQLDAIEHLTEPGAILQFINERFLKVALPEDFASIFLMRWNPSSGQLEYASAGHEPAIFVAGNDQIQLLSSTGFLVGMMEDAEWTTNQISVQSGDRILISTDGLVEAFNPLEGPFGRNRTIQILEEAREKPIESILPTLRHAVQDFVRDAPLTDDLTILVAEFNTQNGA